MPMTFSSLDAILNHGYDTVIDVRSPAEFAEDHIPGAINLPSLDNDQRAEVGTIYKQVSPFRARKIGAGMVIRNVANHIDGPLQDKDGSWRPLIYCWRGGQRSGVFRTILSEIGWRAETVKGGYQSYRRLVNAYLHDNTLPHRLILLDGYTGTAKTEVLQRLRNHDVQILDLEGLARHRGSLLGAMPGGQPSQKMFETGIAQALIGYDPDRPVIVEAESSKIGQLNLPKALWHRMIASPRIMLEAPETARARYLATAYRDVISDPVQLATKLAPLRRLRGHATVDRWVDLSRAGDLVALSQALMVEHYDPAYAKSRKADTNDLCAALTTDALDPAAQDKLAEQIAAIVRSQ